MSTPHICPPDHPHEATATCQTSHGCRCDPCREAHTEYKFYRDNMIRAGKWATHIVDSTGTRRRLEALAFSGWSTIKIAAALGTTQGQVWGIGQKEFVTQETADRVKALFAAAWDKTPPGGASTRTINLARKKGFAPALAWDDIDDPNAVPDTGSKRVAIDRYDPNVIRDAIDGIPVELSASERREVVRVLHNRRWSADRIGEHAGCDRRTVQRIRTELELPHFTPDQVKDAA